MTAFSANSVLCGFLYFCHLRWYGGKWVICLDSFTSGHWEPAWCQNAQFRSQLWHSASHVTSLCSLVWFVSFQMKCRLCAVAPQAVWDAAPGAVRTSRSVSCDQLLVSMVSTVFSCLIIDCVSHLFLHKFLVCCLTEPSVRVKA